MKVKVEKDERWPDYSIFPADGSLGAVYDLPEGVVARFEAAQRAYDDASSALEDAMKAAAQQQQAAAEQQPDQQVSQ